jgi:hypothetical protein
LQTLQLFLKIGSASAVPDHVNLWQSSGIEKVTVARLRVIKDVMKEFADLSAAAEISSVHCHGTGPSQAEQAEGEGS